VAGRSRTTRKMPLLPAGMSEFLRRRAIELIGVTLAVTGLLGFAALATYVPGDTSWNTAGDGAVSNLLGRGGAWFSDFGLQTFGVATLIPPLALLIWGWRLWSHFHIRGLWLRLAATVGALLAFPAALALIAPDARWPVEGGAGGWVGAFLGEQMVALVARIGIGAWLAATMATVLALVALGLALGITRSEVRVAIDTIWWAGSQIVHWIGLAWSYAPTSLPKFGSPDDAKPDIEIARPEPAARAEPELRMPPERPRPAVVAKVVDAMPAQPSKREARERQGRLDLEADGFQLPPLNLLSEPDAQMRSEVPDEEALEQNARLLESVLQDFGVKGEIVRVRQGTVVTRYELEPAPGTRAARVVALADDIARSMSAISARVAVIPGQNVIGIELPNAKREIVYLREMLGSLEYERATSQLPLVLGKDISGSPVVADLGRMPHLLVAGTTGSGKSVAVNAMILSLLYRLSPEECRMIMIDPKMLELSVYDDIPHLLHPVVVDPTKAVMALKWAVKEMNDRYRLMSTLNVRNIAGYNKRLAEADEKGEVLERTVQTGFDPETGRPIYETQPLDMAPLPFIVVVVDEMADLMLVAGKDIEVAIQSLAQKARAAGIHLIIATQRPSVDVITGTIKANLPTRISFQVTSKIDSRTILGEQGAEQLLGMGDMLYMAGGGQVTRVHGPFVSDEEVEEIADFLRSQGEPNYLEAVTDEAGEESLPGMGGASGGGSGDDLFDQAVALVARERKASTSFIQRHLSIGYNRAAKIIERMESEGMVGQANHVGKREVLLPDHSDAI